jgi:hypothetical protein
MRETNDDGLVLGVVWVSPPLPQEHTQRAYACPAADSIRATPAAAVSASFVVARENPGPSVVLVEEEENKEEEEGCELPETMRPHGPPSPVPEEAGEVEEGWDVEETRDRRVGDTSISISNEGAGGGRSSNDNDAPPPPTTVPPRAPRPRSALPKNAAALTAAAAAHLAERATRRAAAAAERHHHNTAVPPPCVSPVATPTAERPRWMDDDHMSGSSGGSGQQLPCAPSPAV